MSDLFHVIYTNAAEYGVAQTSDQYGYRFVLPQPNWQPQSQVDAFAEWVQSLNPTEWLQNQISSETSKVSEINQSQNQSASDRGYAYSCFRLNFHPCVCVAAVFPNFAPDDLGRVGGNLTHVLVTPVREGRDLWIHQILKLVELASEIKLPPVEGHSTRLTRYLEMPRENRVDDPKLTIEYLQKLILTSFENKDEFLEFMELALYSVKTSTETLLRRDNTLEAAKTLATFILALPPRLRLAFYWGCEVNAVNSERRQTFIRLTGNPGSLPQPDGRLYDYVDKFLEILERLNEEDIGWLNHIWNEWDVRAWDELFTKYGKKRKKM